MRISDWSSDVCSSDLLGQRLGRLVGLHRGARGEHLRAAPAADAAAGAIGPALLLAQRHVQARGKGSAQHRVEGFARDRSEEHTSELQSLMRISYAVFCLKKKNKQNRY